MLQGAETTTSTLGDAIAMLHPLLVHFPIALIITAVPAEFLRLRRGSDAASPTARFLVTVGALGALLAGVTGWIKAAVDGGGYDGRDLGWHKWSGVAFTVIAVVLACIAPRAEQAPGRLKAFRLLLVAAAAILLIVGHYGATLAGHTLDFSLFTKALSGG